MQAKRSLEIDVVGVPIDLGQRRRGVGMGPSAIRCAGLEASLRSIGHTVHDRGDVGVRGIETVPIGEPKLRFLEPIVDSLRELAELIEGSVRAGRVPLVLGGDHSLSLGSIAGAAAGSEHPLSVIYIDTHPDFNTEETTPSGNIHGMPLAALAGLGDRRLRTLGWSYPDRPHIRPDSMVVIGAREIDAGEKANLEAAGVHVLTMEMIDRIRIPAVMEEAIGLATRRDERIYISFDMDAMDPSYAPGVGTPKPGGLTYREAHLAVEMLAETERVVGMDLVEVNPILDDRNRTAVLAVQLAASAFGKRIL